MAEEIDAVIKEQMEHIQAMQKQVDNVSGNDETKAVAGSLLSLAQMNVKLGHQIVMLKERVKKLESEKGLQ